MRERDGSVNRIVKYRLLAFSMIAVSTLGSILKEDLQGKWDISRTGFLDAFLVVAFIAGLCLWVVSKIMEKRLHKETEERL